ncbi:MAG: threonine--tRNA ligase, partial [Candidatus Woesearchaeota archaeon]
MEINGKKYDKPVKLAEIAPKDAVVARLDGELVDLSKVVDKDGKVEFFSLESNEGLDTLRHSAAHIMADAVVKLFPDAKRTIGPAIENGFYFDFDVKVPFAPEDLKKIEAEMYKIVKANQKFERVVLSMEEAKRLYKDNKYKLEMIDELEGELTAYKHGDYIDLCRGPHVPSTGYVRAFKLTKVSGCNWRADVKNAPLQRIYGLAFATKDELNQHIRMLEEAEKRDHRKLGKKLGLFSIHDEGPGFIFWLPKGTLIKGKLINYWKAVHKKAGYVLVETPVILNRKLWEQSKHWMNYRENMYTLKIDNEDFAIKPMNCP